MNRRDRIECMILGSVWENLSEHRPGEQWSVMRMQLAGDLVLIPTGTLYMAGPFAHTICRVKVNADGSGTIKWLMPESTLKASIDG